MLRVMHLAPQVRPRAQAKGRSWRSEGRTRGGVGGSPSCQFEV